MRKSVKVLVGFLVLAMLFVAGYQVAFHFFSQMDTSQMKTEDLPKTTQVDQ